VSPTSPATVSYTIDRASAATLGPAGTYYGAVQVVSAGAANSPQSFQVVLNIAPAASLPVPDPQPAGLIFTSAFGAAAPASQPVTLYSSSTAPLPYSASAATLSGGSWLTISPSAGNASATNPGVSTISVTPGTLSPGVYTGGISYQFSAAAVRTVNVTMIIQASGSSPLVSLGESARVGGVCIPKQLVPTQTGLVTNFAQGAALPTPLAIRILQDCGAPVGNAQVIARFSNGDPPLPLQLVDVSSGLYAGTWTPRSASPQVTVTATVTATGFNAATAQITGLVGTNGNPLLATGGVVHIYNPLLGGAVAPGTIVAIYGSNLAAQPVTDSGAPLPAKLGGTSVTIGGIPAPLYYVSPTQIDAQVPFELLPGNQYQVIVNSAGAQSTPASLHISAAAPGILALPNGQVVAQHADYSLVTTASPAKQGEFLVIYLAGMGITDGAIADGAASPSSPLAQPSVPPVLTLNDSRIPVYFAGLTPGFVGLYQMNFQVPTNTVNGNVQLVVSQGSVASNSTFLPVQN
jgi:adhesin/invasin